MQQALLLVACALAQAAKHWACSLNILRKAFYMQGGCDEVILLKFPEHGMHLVFDAKSQKLRLIEVYDLSRVQVRPCLPNPMCNSKTGLLLSSWAQVLQAAVSAINVHHVLSQQHTV